MEFWYEDNNLGSALKVPPDFASRYDSPETWAEARQVMDIFYLRSNAFLFHLQGKADLQRKIAAVHNGNSIQIAMDSTEATWAHYTAGYTTPTLTRTVAQMKELADNGIMPTRVGLQSVLSKPTPDGKPYAMNWRIRDVVEFFKQVKPIYPDLKIGIIDALPTHNENYQTAYLDLTSALSVEGFRLDFIHLDMPFSYPRNRSNGNSWAKMVAVSQFVRNSLGTEFGLICTDNTGGSGSNNLFRQYVLDGVRKFIEAGGEADAYILMSWYPYPDHTTPDDITPIPPGNASQLRIFREMVSIVNSTAGSTAAKSWDLFDGQ